MDHNYYRHRNDFRNNSRHSSDRRPTTAGRAVIPQKSLHKFSRSSKRRQEFFHQNTETCEAYQTHLLLYQQPPHWTVPTPAHHPLPLIRPRTAALYCTITAPRKALVRIYINQVSRARVTIILCGYIVASLYNICFRNPITLHIC